MAMPHRQNPRRPSLLPEVGTIAAAVAAALFLALYGPPAHGADRSEVRGEVVGRASGTPGLGGILDAQPSSSSPTLTG